MATVKEVELTMALTSCDAVNKLVTADISYEGREDVVDLARLISQIGKPVNSELAAEILNIILSGHLDLEVILVQENSLELAMELHDELEGDDKIFAPWAVFSQALESELAIYQWKSEDPTRFIDKLLSITQLDALEKVLVWEDIEDLKDILDEAETYKRNLREGTHNPKDYEPFTAPTKEEVQEIAERLINIVTMSLSNEPQQKSPELLDLEKQIENIIKDIK